MLENLDNIKEVEMMPGFHGKLVHTEKMSIAFWRIEKGSSVGAHSHHHEQLTHVVKGRFEMTVDGETKIYVPGDVAVIPGNASHGGTALEDCEIIDIWSPAREEYKTS